MSSDERISTSLMSEMHSIVTEMIESRLAEILAPRVSEALKSVASESLVWPVPASAFQDRRPEIDALLNALCLGQELPFRLTRKNGSGMSRDVSDGQTALALDYCTQLYIVQHTFRVLSKSDRVRLGRIDLKLDRPANSEEIYPFAFGDYERFWSLSDHWEVKAALLPPYPVASGGKAREIKQLMKWLEAAMLLAEITCFGEWEKHDWSVNSSSGGDRASKMVIRARMLAGMKKLQLVGN